MWQKVAKFKGAEYFRKALYAFKWTDTSMRYLGDNITSDNGKQYALNYPPVISKITEVLDLWMTLPISLAGQFASVKINVLPRLFSMFPV